MNRYDCIVITAHPDDAYIGTGGTMLRLAKKGKKILAVSITDGENGNEDNRIIRSKEFHSAADLCGIACLQMHLPDGELAFCQKELYKKIGQLLLETNPALIITHHPNDRHKDHQAVASIVLAAQDLLWHQLKHTTRLKCIAQFAPIKLDLSSIFNCELNVISDISAFIEDKEKIIKLHVSQQPYLQHNLETERLFSAFLGSLIQCNFAEGFYIRENYRTQSLTEYIDL